MALDGELLFSKHELHRFPEPGEVEDALADRLAAADQRRDTT